MTNVATTAHVEDARRFRQLHSKYSKARDLIQLGAYGSEASANQAWSALTQRYAFLGTLPKSVVQATVGGTTFYRLRVTAGAQANDTCAKLKAGGANCIVVK